MVDDALSEIIDDLWNDCAESNGDSDVSSMQHESRKVIETVESAVQCGMPSLDEGEEHHTVFVQRKTFRGMIRKKFTNCEHKKLSRNSAEVSQRGPKVKTSPSCRRPQLILARRTKS